jgi:FAD-linked sulfhydryl oxidase
MSDKNCFEPICEKEDILNFKRKKTSKLQFEEDPP